MELFRFTVRYVCKITPDFHGAVWAATLPRLMVERFLHVLHFIYGAESRPSVLWQYPYEFSKEAGKVPIT